MAAQFRRLSRPLIVFRDPVYTGKRPRLRVCEDLHIVQIVKQRLGQRLVSISRRLAHGGILQAEELKQRAQVEIGSSNTA